MKFQINGEDREFTDESVPTLTALVATLGMKPDRVAVELNRDIVPRNRAPLPPGSLTASMRPPCASMIERQTARPMPMPSFLVEKKLSNSRSR